MYYEFYIDQFFLEHLLTGYLLLAASVSIRRRAVSWKRMAAASLVNTIMMTVFICAGLPKWYFTSMLAAGMVLFFGKKRKEILKELLFLLFVTVCFGGALEALMTLWKLPKMAGVTIAVILLRCIGRRAEDRLKLDNTVTVQLWWEEQTATFSGMIDTGNQLTEPLTGRPVSIIDAVCADQLLGNGWEGRHGFYLIPYHSIGTEKGWMQGVTIDRMRVEGTKGAAVIQSPVLALYRGQVSAKGQYHVILHPLHAALGK